MPHFSLILLFVISYNIKYLSSIAINNDDLNSVENQLLREKRQTEVEICIIPNIENGNVNILSQKFSTKIPVSNYILINITCEHNYIMYPPNNNIIFCVNGIWDKEIPKCIQCGQRKDTTHKPFVVNGTLSKFGDFPWHVGIYKKDQKDMYPSYKCGGSIIDENSILTVAHCFTDESGKLASFIEYYAAAGKYYSSYNSTRDKYAQKRKVVRIDIHPRYKGYFTNYAWDIAVLVVEEPFKISNLVQPVCVDWETNFENEQLAPNTYGQIAGWGATESDLNSITLELRVLEVPYITAEQCTNRVPQSFIRYITPDKFCAGYTNGSSVCGGDSGGGLVFKKEENKDIRYYIRGLVSVGVQIDGTCDDYKYSTYTQVSSYIPFIQASIRNKIIKTPITPVSPTVSTNVSESSIKPSIPCTTPNREQAKCISIYECNIFLDALQNNPMTETITYIRQSQCGENKRVCCGSTILPLSIIHSNPVTTKPIVHRNLNLLPTPGVCGRQVRVREARITGGQRAKILDFPWIAMLESGTNNESSGFHCGGSLINERYVLTLGRCAHYRNGGSVIRVRLGEYDTETPIDCVDVSAGTGILPNGKQCADPYLDVDVEKIIVHPSYGKSPGNTLYQNDIALIRLARKIVYTDFIKPICLPLNGEKSPPGKQMTIAGWGVTEYAGTPSSIKIKALTFAVAYEECAKIYRESSSKKQLEKYHICSMGKRGVSSCQGDSGVPVMSTLTNSTDIYIEGIEAYGAGCGIGNIPTIAISVSYFINWILDTIEP